MITVNYVTTNNHKFEVAQYFFESAGLADSMMLTRSDMETPEVQADSVEEVARASAAWAGEKLGTPVVVADAGFSITSLQGFPGPYMKYINRTLKAVDLLSLVAGKSDRSATFMDCLAYYDPQTKKTEVFLSKTDGTIASQISARPGSSIDRVFVPQGWDVPIADIVAEERVKVWNVDRWRKMADFLKSVTP